MKRYILTIFFMFILSIFILSDTAPAPVRPERPPRDSATKSKIDDIKQRRDDMEELKKKKKLETSVEELKPPPKDEEGEEEKEEGEEEGEEEEGEEEGKEGEEKEEEKEEDEIEEEESETTEGDIFADEETRKRIEKEVINAGIDHEAYERDQFRRGEKAGYEDGHRDGWDRQPNKPQPYIDKELDVNDPWDRGYLSGYEDGYEEGMDKGFFDIFHCPATIIYRNPHAHELFLLRKFRDEVLKKSFLGRAFIYVYYSTSPYIGRILEKSEFARLLTKKYLNLFVAGISFFLE